MNTFTEHDWLYCLSLWQPWGDLLLGPKDIENRVWATKHRGPLLIHASKSANRAYYDEAMGWVAEHSPSVTMPAFESVQRGGIIGAVRITDCLPPVENASGWRMENQYGWVRENPVPLPFRPLRAYQRLFRVVPTADEVAALKAGGLL